MKKFGIVTLILALCFLLCACDNAAKPTQSPTTEPTQAPTVEPAPPPVTTPVQTPTTEPTQTPDDEPPEIDIEGPDVDAGIDFTEFFTYIMENYEMPALDGTPLDGEFLANFYPELSELDTANTSVHIAMMSGVACELAMVEVKELADIPGVESALQARIDAQIDGGAFYPATIEAWENSSKIVTSGDYVCMYVGENCEEITNLFLSYVTTGTL